ncbi:PREDICTED: ES1 protein homolog, mitochondrial [Lipotes vexillifer]|uniref:ES1 protein homolog, mitochondrial n=1 Tax=Lipotes vexillifer TaxID=118797 RepID=A0A340X0D0_LIPVE|nr:PREDICTED: ES1 protein homolog, mitochondrial [Lipotes vexillifer]
MAAIRALVASRLAVTPAFAPRPGLRALLLGGPAQSPRAALHASAPRPAARVAVVLSGCGVYDGTELHEASSILVHLSRAGAEVQIFAPDIPQMHVIDHTKGQPSEGETRYGPLLVVLERSARIARGNITDLAKLSAANHDAAVFPGGFGAAKNLSTFAVDGGDCRVNKDVERVLKEFHQAGKPIGLCCIAPVLAAKVLRSVEVTVGHEQEEGGRWPHAGTAQVIKALGAKHCVTGVTEAHVDQKNKVVTTPAFMCDTAFHHIHDGVGAMVSKVLELASK